MKRTHRIDNKKKLGKKDIKEKKIHTPKILSKPNKKIKISQYADIIYEKIINSFNVSYLNRIYGNDYNYVKNLLIEKNFIFEKLIYNLENINNEENPEFAKFISGPHMFATLTHQKNKKKIYIIGEIHHTIRSCEEFFFNTKKTFYDYEEDKLYDYNENFAMELEKKGQGSYVRTIDIGTVISNIMNEGIAFVDLFVEKDLFYYFKTNEMYEMYENNDRLYTVANIGKSSEIGRTHLIDIRGSSVLSLDFPSIFENKSIYYEEEEKEIMNNNIYYPISLEILTSKFFKLKDKKKYVKVFIKFQSYLFDSTLKDSQWKDRMVKFILDNDFLKKEIERSYMGKVILSYYKEILYKDDILNIRNEYDMEFMSEVFNELKQLESGKISKISIESNRLIRNLRAYFTTFHSYILDMYTLARIFKHFNEIGSDKPTDPQNIIIYSGSSHSESIIDFLTKIGFDIKNGRKISENCLYTGINGIFFDVN